MGCCCCALYALEIDIYDVRHRVVIAHTSLAYDVEPDEEEKKIIEEMKSIWRKSNSPGINIYAPPRKNLQEFKALFAAHKDRTFLVNHAVGIVTVVRMILRGNVLVTDRMKTQVLAFQVGVGGKMTYTAMGGIISEKGLLTLELEIKKVKATKKPDEYIASLVVEVEGFFMEIWNEEQMKNIGGLVLVKPLPLISDNPTVANPINSLNIDHP